ncbi:CaiB/BaiF CoA-transferase family protein [Sphingomonas sp.]|uniref:CaiB/BaiF CoA transferase family protein n=1 Tax=Sphingomonas sp. TaxID=28214 RepID=UPI002DB92303|nr:CaiB/BaiF CoA-transferase family protein [Sphingomonas sp.]HEU4967679.1 CaiB/BaiF CoA-transferase family protein [Sphingomonas sp.]
MPSSKPLAGLKVLELARILAGPWAGQMLADMGADVIKVERRGHGDDTRGWGPPFVEGADGQSLGAAYYHSCNRGKRSITADFEDAADMERVRTLARDADIVIENFKTGGLKRYGLDYESLKAINPRIIYCSITGFGQTGPYAPRAGYDYLIQAMGGLMSITGLPNGEPGGGPMRVGVAVADLFTGIYAAGAILAAVHRRHETGQGAWIDMALLDVQTSVLANQAMNYLVSGEAPGLMGNAHPNVVPYQPFETSDGRAIVAVGNDGQFVRFAALLGVPELADDPDYKTNAARIVNRDRLIPILAERTATMTRADLLAALEREGVPGGPINDIAQALADPHVQARGMRVELDAPHVAGGTLSQVRSPIVIDGEPMVADRAPPALGADDPDWR